MRPDTLSLQTPFETKRPVGSAEHPKVQRIEVYWTAVTYKTVVAYGLLILLIILAGLYVAIPERYAALFRKISSSVASSDPDAAAAVLTQAKFVNLDGKVQVKKVNSVQWVAADYRTSLDKGDFVQTGPDGAARITFADGTFYTIKSDTLIMVEENSMSTDKPKQSAVRITTGSVDLATPNWTSSDSKAVVRVDDATAQLHSNSRAAVKADPEKRENEIVVSRGSMEVQRGAETVEVGQHQKASFSSGKAIVKTDVLAPPDLVEPLNLAPIIAENPKSMTIRFVWKAVPDAISYTLRVSSTATFTKTVKEATKISGTSVELSGFEGGDYWWNVMAVDAKRQTSEISAPFKFTLVAQGKTQEMMLEIESTQLHGRMAEIIGRTEPGAVLIVNGQTVPNIGRDGTFRHFTEPLEPGEHTFVIIGQNRRGGMARQQVSVVVPN
jgi:hypothetical protein